MKRALIIFLGLLSGSVLALAEPNGHIPSPLDTQALCPVLDYPPSSNWWTTAPLCRIENSPGITIEVHHAGTINCGVAVIKKGNNVYADAINDGGPLGVPVAADDVVAVAYGAVVPCTGFCYHKVLLYGIKQNGHIVVAAPVPESGGGRKHTVYTGNNTVVISNPDAPDPGRRYCFDGTDWFQGNGPTSCDMTHHARLTNLRAKGDPFLFVRDDCYGP
jgi:hypothetical protein